MPLTESQKLAKLITMLRRYMLEHNKGASKQFCRCPICVEAAKLLARVENG